MNNHQFTMEVSRDSNMLCNWIGHSYRLDHSTGINDYLICCRAGCNTRRVVGVGPGYQPADWDWLQGKENER